jgi:LuxR family maltose regulon positive regulatory protein
MSGEMARLYGWLRALPETIVRSRPRLCIYDAWISNIVGDFEIVETRLQDVEKWLGGKVGDSSQADLIGGMLAATRTIIKLMEGDCEKAVELSEQALAYLPEENLVWRSVVVRNQGNAFLLKGQLSEAARAFQDAFHISHKAGNIYMMIVSLYELAEMQIIQGKLYLAERTCRRGLQIARDWGAPRLPITGTLRIGLAEVLRQWNRLEEAKEQVDEGIRLSQQGKSLGMQVCGFARLGMIAHALGDTEAESRAFERAASLTPMGRAPSFMSQHDIRAKIWEYEGELLDQPATAGFCMMTEAANISRARLLLIHGRVVEALSLLENLKKETEASGRNGRLVEILILESLAFQKKGKSSQAYLMLGQALTLAEPQRYIRVFVDEGLPMASLVAGYMRKPSRGTQDYLNILWKAFTGESDSRTEVKRYSEFDYQRLFIFEPLSERELEILRLISSGLSNKEAARVLVVAQSTIQWHTKNIYRKLNVNSRTQAGVKARELGILGQ